MKTKLLLTLTALTLTFGLQPSAFGQGTAFTYQGRLTDASGLAKGTYDLRFSAWDAASGPAQVGGSVTNAATAVSNGLFTVTLDFGAGVFTGAQRWLEIGVRTNGGGSFSTLTPRQPVTSTPYAVLAANAATAASVASGAVGPAALQPGAVDSSKISDGTIALSDLSSALASNTFWRLTGNAGTVPGTHFVGTADNQPLELRANNARVLRLEPNASSPNIVGGHPGNFVASGAVGAVIAGGGLTGNTNRVGGSYSTVSGGYNNAATLGSATVAGGDNNLAGQDRATVGGGFNNRAVGLLSTVAGGDGNVASGSYSTVPGGSLNVAGGSYSFAAGRQAKATNQGAFVWADSQGADFGSTTNNQFSIRAAGGVRLSDNTSLSFGATTRQMISLWTMEYGLGVQANTLYARSGGGFAWYRGGAHDNSIWNPGAGGTNLMALDGNGELFVNSTLTLDSPGVNSGGLRPGVVFGYGSGEGIASKRSAGGNQYGLDLYTASLPRLSIANNGDIGIGTATPTDARLDLEGTLRMNDHDIRLRAATDRGHGLGYRGFISSQGIDGPFLYGFNGGALGTGNPDAIALRWDWVGNVWVSNNLSVASLTVRNPQNATTISLNGGSGEATVKVLNITGGSDLAEPFPMAAEIPAGALVVIDDERPGQLKLSDRAYDTRVAGIVSGANGVQPGLTLRQEGVLEGSQHVALTGRVYALADATQIPIKPGDLLTTSATPGHAMKVADHPRAPGAVIGKAMSALKEGKGYVLVLVSLQ